MRRTGSGVCQWRLVVAACVIIAGLAGQACAPIPIRLGFKRDQSLGAYATTIVQGTTTRADVERQLGAPDVEADDSSSRVNLGTPLVKYFDKHNAERGWMNSIPYSSMSPERIALLYLEIEARQLILFTPVMVGLAYTRLTISRNKLLLSINKKTGVVEEARFSKEFER